MLRTLAGEGAGAMRSSVLLPLAVRALAGEGAGAVRSGVLLAVRALAGEGEGDARGRLAGRSMWAGIWVSRGPCMIGPWMASGWWGWREASLSDRLSSLGLAWGADAVELDRGGGRSGGRPDDDDPCTRRFERLLAAFSSMAGQRRLKP